MKRALILAAIGMAFASSIVYAGPGYNWSTGSGANWVTPDTTNIQQGQLLVITSTTPYPTIATSSTTPVGMGSFRLAQIKAITPNALGQIVFCSDCGNTPLCVSSGTVINSWEAVVLSTTGARNDCR